MDRTRIFRLSACSREQRLRIREAQREAARVYAHCAALHTAARHAHARWPGRRELQTSTKGGYALHSQTVQAICCEFLANVQTTRALRRQGCRAARYPQWQAEARPQTVAAYRPLTWPAQAVALQHGRLILPMGRGRKSLVFARPADFPDEFGSVRLVFDGERYALHVAVKAQAPQACAPAAVPATEPDSTEAPTPEPVRAAIDLGEIHLGALVSTTGSAAVVSGRGIRAAKRLLHKQLGQLARKRARCKRAAKRAAKKAAKKKGQKTGAQAQGKKHASRRQRRLAWAAAKRCARVKRQVRDLRHKATRLLIDAALALRVQELFVGDPHGVRKRASGRRHNQRMSGWEYGRDKAHLTHKGEAAGIPVVFGDERGTSSTCPGCGHRHRPRGRVFACPHCGLRCHRDVVGGVNQNRRAWGLASVPVPGESRTTYLRPGHASLSMKNARGARAALRLNSKGPAGSSSRPDTGHGRRSLACGRVAATAAKAEPTCAGVPPAQLERHPLRVSPRRHSSEAHPL